MLAVDSTQHMVDTISDTIRYSGIARILYWMGPSYNWALCYPSLVQATII